LTKKQPASPTAAMTTPPSDGPKMPDPLKAMVSRLTAFISSPSATSVGTSDCREGTSKDWVNELKAPMSRTCHTWMRSVYASTASSVADAIIVRLVASRIRRRSRRSATTPPMNANTRRGSAWLTPSRPR